MILGTLTSRQEHSLINSLHLSTKPIKSIYNAYNYNFAAHFNIAYKEYMYLHVTLKTPKHLWWKLSLHNLNKFPTATCIILIIYQGLLHYQTGNTEPICNFLREFNCLIYKKTCNVTTHVFVVLQR